MFVRIMNLRSNGFSGLTLGSYQMEALHLRRFWDSPSWGDKPKTPWIHMSNPPSKMERMIPRKPQNQKRKSAHLETDFAGCSHEITAVMQWSWLIHLASSHKTKGKWRKAKSTCIDGCVCVQGFSVYICVHICTVDYINHDYIKSYLFVCLVGLFVNMWKSMHLSCMWISACVNTWARGCVIDMACGTGCLIIYGHTSDLWFQWLQLLSSDMIFWSSRRTRLNHDIFHKEVVHMLVVSWALSTDIALPLCIFWISHWLIMWKEKLLRVSFNYTKP